MPEHDLLLQQNQSIQIICGQLGNMDGKLDVLIANDKQRCEDYKLLDERVTNLEHDKWYRNGAAAVIALLVAWGISLIGGK